MNRSALPRSRRWTTAVVGGSIAGAALLGGGVALADGGGDTTPSTGAPTPPAGGPSAAAPAGEALVGTVTAVSEDSLTLTDDTGAGHTVALDAETRTGPAGPGAGGPAPTDRSTPPAPPADAPADAPADSPADLPTPPAAEDGSLTDLAVGDRVEVRVTDGTATEVHEVRAHVDGVVVSVDGTDLTVVTTPGLRVDVDAAALSALPGEGDQVHLQGTVSDDGHTVVAADGAR